AVALVPYHHRPVHGLAPRQELRLGQDRRAGAPLVAAVPAALPLGLQAGRAGDALDLVAGGARLAHLDDGDHPVLSGLRLAGRPAAAAPPAAAGHRVLGLLGLLGRLLLGRLLLRRLGLGLLFLAL